MISVYKLKPLFQNMLRPLVKILVGLGVTANQVTILAVFLSAGTGVLIYYFRMDPRILFIVPGILFIRMALNAIDGMLAREHNMESSLGSFLNELGDIFSDTFIYFPFIFIPGLNQYLILSVVFLALVTEFAGLNALQVGATRRYDGPMGKSDRALVMGLLALLIAFGLKPGIWADVMLGIVSLLMIVTMVNRVHKALKEIE